MKKKIFDHHQNYCIFFAFLYAAAAALFTFVCVGRWLNNKAKNVYCDNNCFLHSISGGDVGDRDTWDNTA